MALRYCSNCGEKVQKKYINCPNCGIDLYLEDDKDLFEDDIDNIDDLDKEITEDEIRKLKEFDDIPDIGDDMPSFDEKDLW